MATTENEYYLRSILLLVEGGSYISKKILYRQLSGDLSTILKTFEHKLKRELHEKQIEKVFPRNGNTVVDTWDLQMLIIIVLRLFHNSLKHEDKKNLGVIKMLRNEVQAHSSSVSLDDVQYENIKDQLRDALISLASGFEENVQKECRSFINKYTYGPLDVMSARECLKDLQNNDVLLKQVLEKVESSKKDVCTHLTATSADISQKITDLEKNLIDQLQRLDLGTFSKKIKVGMHVELSLGGPTEEWIHLMERTLNDVFNEAYKAAGEKFEDMKKSVEDFLDDIKHNTTINFKGSKIKCITLMFECLTYSGLLNLLQYVTSSKYQRRLQAVAEALSIHFKVDTPVTATSTISPECLQNALDSLFGRQNITAKIVADADRGTSKKAVGIQTIAAAKIDADADRGKRKRADGSHTVVKIDADTDRGTSKKAGVGGAGDALGKSNATLYCFSENISFGEKTGKKSIQKIKKLEDIFQVEDEHIQRVFLYKYPLTPLSSLDFFFYHNLVVFETQKRWWSIERSLDGITIQRSTSVDTILQRYRKTTRTKSRTLEKSSAGHSSVIELIKWLHGSGELNKNHNFLTSNCTTFANVVLKYVTVPRLVEEQTKVKIAHDATNT